MYIAPSYLEVDFLFNKNNKNIKIFIVFNKLMLADKLKLILGVALGRSLLDYVITQTFFLCDPSALQRPGFLGDITRLGSGIVSNYPGVGKGYFAFLQAFGFFAAAAYGLYKNRVKDGVDAIPFAGIGTFLAENLYYVWVSLFGDLNGCYGWYTGNPLNPDGHFGYSWTNPMNMKTYFLGTMALYIFSWLGLRLGMYLYRK
jgi:hypothetical protein